MYSVECILGQNVGVTAKMVPGFREVAGSGCAEQTRLSESICIHTRVLCGSAYFLTALLVTVSDC